MPFDLPDAGVERRLHPLSWLFQIGAIVRSLIVPAIVVLFASGGSRYELWVSIFIIPASIMALVRYWIFRYRLDPDEMVIRDGLLTRNERHIPYARIQNIDVVRNPFHRIFGVALVRLETASGSKPEAMIRVLSMDAIAEMRGRVFEGRDAHAAADGQGATVTSRDAGSSSEAETLLRLPTKELIRLGIISNRGLALVAAAAGVMWQTGAFDQDWTKAARLAIPLPTQLPTASWQGALLIGAVAVVTGLVLLWTFSILWTIIRLHGFVLRRRGDDLRTEYGLFTRVTGTIPTPRIQLVSIREGPLHRRFGRVSIRVKTAGSGGSESEQSETNERQWLAPIVSRDRAAGLIRAVLPEVDLTAVDWQPIEAGARRRILRRGLLIAVILTASTVWWLRFWSAAVFVGIATLAWLHASLWVRHAGYALTEWGVLNRSGWLFRNTSLVRFDKVQSVLWSQSPFDRRYRMASLAVDTAGSAGIGHGVAIDYLDERVAAGIQQRLYRKAGTTAFRW